MLLRLNSTQLVGLAAIALALSSCITPRPGTKSYAELYGSPTQAVSEPATKQLPLKTKRGVAYVEEINSLDEDEITAEEMATAEKVQKPKDSVSQQLYLIDWPVDSARLSRGFLPKRRGRPHLGLDLAAPKGTPIFAAHDGVVIYSGREFKGYGKMVMIEAAQFATLYAHFNEIKVREGQNVRRGDVIGLMGRTGRATGVHLHFEVRTDNGPIDPLPLLPPVVR